MTLLIGEEKSNRWGIVHSWSLSQRVASSLNTSRSSLEAACCQKAGHRNGLKPEVLTPES